MSYLKQIWRDLVSGGTTLTADRLNHMEDGIAAANDAWDSVAPAALDVSTGAGWASGAGRFHRIGRLVVGSLWSALGADRYAYAGLPRPAADGPVCIFISDKTRMAILCTVDEQGRLDMEIPMRFGEAGCIFVCYVSA